MFEIQQRETRHLAEKRTEEEEESRMIRCFLGSGIAVITWRHCLPSILMGEYLLGSESFVQVAETGQQTPLNSIHSRSEWRETDKVNVPLLWKRFQRSGTIKIESLLLSFFFFFPPLQSQDGSPSGWKLERVSQWRVSLRVYRIRTIFFLTIC